MNSDFCLSRRHFLEGCAATLGVALVGCASNDNAKQTLQATPQGAGFVIRNAPQLGQIDRGQAVAFEFPGSIAGLLFHTMEGKMGAVNAVCTHAGCVVNWNGTDPKAAFVCPCHGSQFAQSGAVLKGPAAKPLAHYTVQIQGENAVLTPA